MLFSKRPEIGKVKTRLIPALGARKAYELYCAMLRHCIELAENTGTPFHIYLKGDKKTSSKFLEKVLIKEQQGQDLGQCLLHAFTQSFVSYQNVVVIGGDCVSIDASHLDAAFEKLNEFPCVVTPAEDGGFVLLGFQSTVDTDGVFNNIEWGSSEVWSQLQGNLSRSGIEVYEMPCLWDIDEPEDLIRLNDIAKFHAFIA